jgi:hypothetical protein
MVIVEQSAVATKTGNPMSSNDFDSTIPDIYVLDLDQIFLSFSKG